MADSIRIPTDTESLIILNVTFQRPANGEGKATSITAKMINDIYRRTAEEDPEHLVMFSEEQNVSSDVTGVDAAVVIEGQFNHTRTAFINVDLSRIPNLPEGVVEGLGRNTLRIPVVHAKIFGWYDNEYGSYTNRMGDLTVHVHRNLL